MVSKEKRRRFSREFKLEAVIFTMSGKDAEGDYQETARMLGARRGFEKPVGIGDLLPPIRDAVGTEDR